MGKPKTAKERQNARRGKLKKDVAVCKANLEKDWLRKADLRKNKKKMSKKEQEKYKIKERIRIKLF